MRPHRAYTCKCLSFILIQHPYSILGRQRLYKTVSECQGIPSGERGAGILHASRRPGEHEKEGRPIRKGQSRKSGGEGGAVA